jgi:hypothetical protein
MLSCQRELWSILLKRDFPEHYAICESKPDEWYKDLYQYGAYFIVDSSINLYPGRVVRTAFAENSRFGILTSRSKRGFQSWNKRSYLRRPFEQYAGLSELEGYGGINSSIFKSNQLLYGSVVVHDTNVVFTKSAEYSYANHKLHGLCPLKRYQSRRWNPVLVWLRSVFEIETLDVQILRGTIGDFIPDTTEFRTYFHFRGQLRKGHILSFATINPMDIEISDYLSTVVYPYTLGYPKERYVEHATERVHVGPVNPVIQCSNPINKNTPANYRATCINGVQIPLSFELKIPITPIEEV